MSECMDPVLPMDAPSSSSQAPRLPRGKSGDLYPSQAVREYREKYAEELESQPMRDASSRLIAMKAKSLHEVSKMTVRMSDIELGYEDLAEMRSDGSGSFYSSFTSAHMDMPKCLDKWHRLHTFWSFCMFQVSALRHLLFNWENASMVLSGLASTLICSEKVGDFRATYQTSAIFIGLVFPLVFLISQTWLRREKGAERLAAIKANCVQLVLKLVVNGGELRALRVVECTRGLLEEIGKFLPQDCDHSGLRLSSIYYRFAEMQAEPECALLTRFMLDAFEKLRVQRDYRTPWKLNYFCFMFGSWSPVLCGPLFASMGCTDGFSMRFSMGQKIEDSDCGYGTPGAYLSSFFFALVISSLLSIVKALEDPFSLSGPDDVISSFSFETNALLHMIEQRKPGILKKGLQSLQQGSMPAQAWGVDEKARAEQAFKQGAAASSGAGGADDDDEEDGD